MKTTLRTPEMEKKYIDFLKTDEANIPFFWDRAKVVIEYQYWKLCENDFPYDRIYIKHRLLAPRRKVKTFMKLTFKEILELNQIKERLNYDQFIENLGDTHSIPDYLHYHICKLKQ